MKSTRDEVYVAIHMLADEVESTYKAECAKRGLQHTPLFNWETSEFIRTLMALDSGLVEQPCADSQQQLGFIQCIAAWCVLCMEHHGCCKRDVNDGDEAMFFYDPPLSAARVESIINTERQYQTELGASRTDGKSRSIASQVIIIHQYLNKVVEAWTNNPGDEYALDMLRKVVASAVWCLEDHGVIDRENPHV